MSDLHIDWNPLDEGDGTRQTARRQIFMDGPKPPFQTSLDLLKSESPLLQTLYKLPVSQHVKMHSIIGNGRCSLGDGPGDGIVGINSARHPGAVSECYIPTTHTAIHGRTETVNEVWRILCEHHREYIDPRSSLERGELPGLGHPDVVPEVPKTIPDDNEPASILPLEDAATSSTTPALASKDS